MVDLVFPQSSSPGVHPQESGGRLINAFIEKAPVGAPGDTVWRRTPGLQRVAETLTTKHTRGFLDCEGPVLWVLDDKIYTVDSSFALTNEQVLDGTTPVTMARNNRAPPQNVAVTENGAFVVTTGGVPESYPDVDLPGSPTSVAELNGYFLWTYAGGRIYASQLNSTEVADDSFHEEHGVQLRRGVKFAGRFYAFGDKWTVVFRDAGTSPFPLAREVVIPRGVIGTFAVAGWETGWANELIFVGDDFNVYKLQGYNPIKISIPSISRDVQDAALAGAGGRLEAHVYMHEGNALWTLTYPGQWTWEFNLSTGQWHERRSYQQNDWRARRSIRVFNRWLVGDDKTGKLFEVNKDYFYEDLDNIIWEVVSGILASFPQGIAIPRASFNMTVGIGKHDGVVNPKVMIDWSLDGGYSFGIPLLRALGAPGQSKAHPYVLSCGLSRGQGIRFRLRVSDPVSLALFGGEITSEPRGP